MHKELIERREFGESLNSSHFGTTTGDISRSLSMHEVVENGKIEQLESLITRGADVNAKDREYSTPLHWAAMAGKADMAKMLLRNGAQVNAKNAFFETPLHWAENREIARLLVSHGAHVDAMDTWSTTPADWAKAEGDPELYQFLGTELKRG